MKKLLLIWQIIIPNLIFGQITGYVYQNIQKFDVYVEVDALNNHPQEVDEAIDLLTIKLEEINNFGLEEEIVRFLAGCQDFYGLEYDEWSCMLSP